MSASEAPTPTAKTSARFSSKRAFFLIALVVVITAFVLGLSPKDEKEVALDSKAAAELWVEEVLSTAAETPCQQDSRGLTPRELSRFRKFVPIFQERARLDPGDNLRMLKRVEALIQCTKSADDIEREEMDSWLALRDKLQTRVQLLLRAHYARLRRAENQGDSAASLSEVRSLRRLLAAHLGPISSALRKRQRLLGG